MKAILVGIGGFGYGWYRRIREQYREVQLVVVDVDAGQKSKLGADDVPFYTSLQEAIERERPDFIINVTPKQCHLQVNSAAFDHKLPVFSEKPIADNYEDAVRMVERAEREGIPFMIAENYRRFPAVRKLKRLLEEGAVGAIRSVEGQFYRHSDNQTEDKTSLLEEVVVHHFDLVRYLTGREVGQIFAAFRHRLHLVMELQAGITATFSFSMQSTGPQTDWAGNWRIEGTDGCLELIGKQIHWTKNGETTVIDDFSDVPAPGPFSEFLQSLEENREAETSAKDYLKNQALAHYARESITTNRMVDTSASWGYGPVIVRNFLAEELKESVSHRGKGMILGTRLYGQEDFDTPIRFLSYTEIPPGTSIGYHGHREDEEIYIILEGAGVMTVNGQTLQVRPGDVVLNKPWWKHGLENTGDTPIKAIIFEVDKA